jgi:hypothetical protein
VIKLEKNRNQDMVNEMFSMTKNKLDLCDRLKNLARRGFGCIAYRDRRTAYIFTEDGTVKHPQGIKGTGEEWCTASDVAYVVLRMWK